MFRFCSNLKRIDTLPFINVYDAKEMFAGCSSLTSIDTSPFTNVTNADGMFWCCESLTSIDISPFINVNNIYYMFMECINLTSIEISSLDNLSNNKVYEAIPSSVTDVNIIPKISFPYEINTINSLIPPDIFLHYTLSEDLRFTTIANYENNVSSLDVNTSSTPYDIQITDIENLTTNNLKTAIINAGKFVNITWSENAVWNGTDATEMFYECSPLTSIDTSPFTNVTNVQSMFYECSSLKEISTISFGKVTNAREMFAGCSALTNIDLRCFINLTNALVMFSKASVLTEVKEEHS